MSMYPQRYQSIYGDTTPDRPANDPELEGSRPKLYMWLTETKIGDQDRQTGSLTIFVEDGLFKAWVNDRWMHQYAVKSARTLDSLLDEIETSFNDGSIDWRKQKKGGRAKGSKWSKQEDGSYKKDEPEGTA